MADSSTDAMIASARSAMADFLGCDADEIMHSTRSGESLADAIDRVGKSGADVLNFDEFVMLPLRENYVRDLRGPQPIRDYYFFEPTPKRLMRVWRPARGFSMAESGGASNKGRHSRLGVAGSAALSIPEPAARL